MSLNNSSVPKWVLDLQSPPASKSKSGSIPDPPGYPSQSSALSKVQLLYNGQVVYKILTK